MFSRYAGARIVGYRKNAFAEYRLIAGPVAPDSSGANSEKILALEGGVTRILYQAPKDRSTLEIFRNYEKELRQAGFQTLYQCAANECNETLYKAFGAPWTTHGWVSDVFIRRPEGEHYLAARRVRPEGDIYVALYVAHHTLLNSLNYPYVQLDIIELGPMEEKLVTVDADALAKDIETHGHVSVYGIYFDTDSDRIKAESWSSIEQIARLLAENPELNVIIVGHTDNQGGIQYNLDLSQRRAAAVRDALVERYGIEIDRLAAVGIGFFAPVASNRTEQGRAKNRRVELVEWEGETNEGRPR